MNTRPAREHLRATRTCNKLLGVYTWPREPVMDLEGGVLARIDRNLLAALGQDATYRMVRVPATAVKWATWKRDCDSAGISMGRAIAALIDRELTGVFGDRSGDHLPVFAEQVEEELSRLQEQVDRREEKAVAVEELLRAWSEHLRRWEGELEVLERRVEFALKAAAQPRDAAAKVGRNERCPCGSGLKYKHCHGLSGRAQDGALR